MYTPGWRIGTCHIATLRGSEILSYLKLWISSSLAAAKSQPCGWDSERLWRRTVHHWCYWLFKRYFTLTPTHGLYIPWCEKEYIAIDTEHRRISRTALRLSNGSNQRLIRNEAHSHSFGVSWHIGGVCQILRWSLGSNRDTQIFEWGPMHCSRRVITLETGEALLFRKWCEVQVWRKQDPEQGTTNTLAGC